MSLTVPQPTTCESNYSFLAILSLVQQNAQTITRCICVKNERLVKVSVGKDSVDITFSLMPSNALEFSSLHLHVFGILTIWFVKMRTIRTFNLVLE